MKDDRLSKWKFRAEDDLHLTKGARWLAIRLAGEKIRDRNFLPDSEFKFAWRDAQNLTGLCKRQCYTLIDELRGKSYLRLSRAMVGSPPTNHYFFVFLPWKPPQSMRKFVAEKSLRAAKNAAARAKPAQPKREFPKRKGAHKMDCACSDCKKIRRMFD